MAGAGELGVALESAIAAMRTAGAVVVDVQVPNFRKWQDPEFDVLLYEFKDGINRYLARRTASPRSLAELIAWNRANEARVMPFFRQELFELAEKKGPLTDGAYLKSRDASRRLAGVDGLLSVLTTQNLEAVVAPSTGPAWKTDYAAGDRTGFPGGYGAAAVAGTPSITIPIGESRGLPFGMTLMGAPFTEGRLIGFAYALERLTHARRSPSFAVSVD